MLRLCLDGACTMTKEERKRLSAIIRDRVSVSLSLPCPSPIPSDEGVDPACVVSHVIERVAWDLAHVSLPFLAMHPARDSLDQFRAGLV
jgi:hypothetical protein